MSSLKKYYWANNVLCTQKNKKKVVILSQLFLNRLKTPRVKIPPGSVGIVEKFCNIYPYESPGGWHIIGRTPIKLFNTKNNSNPCLLSPGDSVKFKLISKKEFEKLNNE